MKKKTLIINALLASASLMLLAGCVKKPAKTTNTNTWVRPTTETTTPVTTNTTVTEWDEPTYNWNEDFTKCTASRNSKNIVGLSEIETADSVYSVKTPVKCMESGLGLYTATFNNSAFEGQTKEVEIPATGHTYDDDNDSTCNVCGEAREQVNNSLITSVSAKTYNATKQGLVEGEDFNVSFGSATVYYKAKDASDETYTLDAPKYAGDYTARIVVEEKAAYKGIDDTVDFTIAKKKLTNVKIERQFGAGTTASKAGNSTTGWGICEGDFVTVKVTTNADYGTYAYAGNNKEVIAAEITYDSANSYELPPLDEITFNITKYKINLANGPVNKDAYNNIWAGTGSSIPRLSFNIGIAGNKSDAWSAEDKIEKWDGSDWVSIGADYSAQASYASANAGKYKISTTITCYQNYEIVGDDTYSLEFEVKEVININATDKVTIEAGEEKAFFIPVSSGHLYEVGSQLGDADIEVYGRDAFGIYREKINYLMENTIKYYGSNVLVRVKADSKITNKVVIEDVSYSDRIRLTNNETYITTTNGTGKWVEYYVSESDFGTAEFEFLFDGLGDYVYFSDETYHNLDLLDDDGAIGEIWSQGGEISILIYLEHDITNGMIYFE